MDVEVSCGELYELLPVQQAYLTVLHTLPSAHTVRSVLLAI